MSASGSSASPATHRIVRATTDYSGSPDQLNFRAGDEILVVSEPKSGWCMGEVSGRRGRFPINCVEEVSGGRTRIPPPLPSRMTNIAQRAQNDIVSEDGESILSDDFQYVTTQESLVYDEPFGDHHLAKSPMVVEHDHDHYHEHDPTGDIAMEEEEMKGLFGAQSPTTFHDVTSTPAGSTRQNIEVGNIAGNSVADNIGAGNATLGGVRQPPALPQRKQSVKKPPPPPPARRSTISGLAPPQGIGSSGGPSTSAPSSTANLAVVMMASSAASSSSSSAVSFPPPPAGRRRPTSSRSRSAASLSHLPPPPPTPDTVSPFDN